MILRPDMLHIRVKLMRTINGRSTFPMLRSTIPTSWVRVVAFATEPTPSAVALRFLLVLLLLSSNIKLLHAILIFDHFQFFHWSLSLVRHMLFPKSTRGMQQPSIHLRIFDRLQLGAVRINTADDNLWSCVLPTHPVSSRCSVYFHTRNRFGADFRVTCH